MDAILNFINDNLILFGGAALGGFVMFIASYKTLAKMFRMVLTSAGDIFSFTAGQQVEIAGTATGETPLSSPISKTACVLWQVEVMERRSSGRSSRWVTVYSNTSTAPFEVYDATGRMKIQPGAQMELLLRNDTRQSSGLFRPMDEQTQAALNELGVNTKGILKINKSMRVQERFIEQGDEIHVFGKTSENYGARIMDTNSPLIVSDYGKWQLLAKFSWQVFFSILMGLFIGAVLAWYFTNR